MKKLCTMLACIFVALFSIGQGKMDLDIKGAWRMTKQIANDGKKDTLLKQEQLKIYTDRYMMYASPRATDSFGEYGIATYERNGDKVVENIFYTSSQGQVTELAVLKISKIKNGYRQVIDYSNEDGTFFLIEDYVRVGNGTKSQLDGAWEQVKNIFVNSNGDTTQNIVVTQFKIYESGYFIWANPSKDPASNNYVTPYGYGTFKTNGDNRIIETNINSTYRSLVDQPVDIEIEMAGTDSYKQTIRSDDGGRSIEVYNRLK